MGYVNHQHYLMYYDLINFISIPNNLSIDIEKILEKYQIKVVRYLNEDYVLNLFLEKKTKLPEMASKIINGYNENEVSIIPKNIKKTGFFEKFFQLFS